MSPVRGDKPAQPLPELYFHCYDVRLSSLLYALKVYHIIIHASEIIIYISSTIIVIITRRTRVRVWVPKMIVR